MIIAIDAMGGDHAPKAPVEGALLAAKEHPDTTFLLVGRDSEIRPLLKKQPSNVEILPANDVIDPGAEPVRSVRRQKDSSLVVCTNLVREGKADAMVSAGNTGAFMVAGLLIVGRMEGIERPALAAMLPTFSGKGVLLLDAGANADCTPHQLVQFAKMGQAYMRFTNQVEDVRTALLNIGTEAGKGNELSKASYPLLESACTHFVGNVEARDLLNEVCDVVVCDGFVGNAILKFYEGVGAGLSKLLKELFLNSFWSKLAALMLSGGLRRFYKRFDYAEYGGGPFLGVRGVLVKAHGSSKSRAFEVAILQAHKMVSSGLIHALEQDLCETASDPVNEGGK